MGGGYQQNDSLADGESSLSRGVVGEAGSWELFCVAPPGPRKVIPGPLTHRRLPCTRAGRQHLRRGGNTWAAAGWVFAASNQAKESPMATLFACLRLCVCVCVCVCVRVCVLGFGREQRGIRQHGVR